MGDGWFAEITVSGCRVAVLNVFAPKVCDLLFWTEKTGEGAAAEGWRSNQELRRREEMQYFRRGEKQEGRKKKSNLNRFLLLDSTVEG